MNQADMKIEHHKLGDLHIQKIQKKQKLRVRSLRINLSFPAQAL
jgi:hypothetical protein